METRLTGALPALVDSLRPDGPAEDLLRALTTHTPVGVFLSDATGACRYVNRRWCELTGLDAEQALGDGWSASLHPDDRERVSAEWAVAAEEQRDSVIAYRFLRPDGTIAWIEGYASAFHDQDGRLAGWIGTCLDVTAHRTAEQELERERERELFEVAFEAAPIGVALVGLDGRYLRANEALCRLLGYEQDELLQLDVSALTHPDDREVGAELMRRLVAGEIASYQRERRYLRKDGSVVWTCLSVSLIRDENRAPMRFIAHVEDIAERKQAERELRDLAERDALTGLLNRRSFQQELEQRLRRPARGGERLCLLLLDIDRFKRVNDTLGHQAGDHALVAIAAALRAAARSGDVLARLGGDELAVLAYTSDVAGLAERLLDAIRASDALGDGTPRPLTASIGIAQATPELSPAALLAVADRALYAAKRAGRDRFAGVPPSRATA